jgi:methylenetetrahydrofolate--tRNA-(uracil-5-)-methyltransferase
LTPERARVTVIGGGLAGCEAAWQLAVRGVPVDLFEMRPARMTAAHATGDLAELVCSNSLGADQPGSAPALLKSELRQLGSMLIAAADDARVPAGKALAVDRRGFSAGVMERLAAEPAVRLLRAECESIPDGGLTVIASGPLTSDRLAASIAELTGEANLHFYDAVAPIVTAASVDERAAFWGSRYDREGKDYLNCPLDDETYQAFWAALASAEQHPRREFERTGFFEGCLPVEELARRGRDTLRYGPLKPVGLIDPATGRRPYAVAQLRREDHAGDLLNLVGFQTNLTFGEQRRVFRQIPALARAEFVRYGVMHRNTFLRGPKVLLPTLESRAREGLWFAGQIAGVEGYTESIATGLVAGINAARRATGRAPVELPAATVIGSLCRYVSSWPSPDFQPMNANFGLLPRLPGHPKRLLRPEMHASRALAALAAWQEWGSEAAY